MDKIDVAGLKISPIPKKKFLDASLERIKAGQKTFVITPYSEFLYQVFQDPKILEFLNASDFALPDGIGIFWAKKYLSLPLTAKGYWTKILQAAWQIKYSLAAIIFNRSWILKSLGPVTEKIVGADLIWDLAKMADENALSIFLLGGFDDTAKLVANNLQKKYPTLKIAGTSSKNPSDGSIVSDVNADILLVAYGPIKQEQWIYENLNKLNVKLAIGLGGTFDYVAGIKSAPPTFIRYSGLEWLWRLITQPSRVKRIWQATFGLISELLLYKICIHLPYRKNVASVILNKQNKILVVQRNPHNKKTYIGEKDRHKFLNYWQFPQGDIDRNESLEQGTQREIFEETGLKDLKILSFSKKTNQYDFGRSWRRIFDRAYSYQGQIQNIAYLKTLTDDPKIILDNDELIAYKWVAANELAQVIHNERAGLTNIVVEDLKEILKNANI